MQGKEKVMQVLEDIKKGYQLQTDFLLSPWFNQKFSIRMTKRIIFWVNRFYLKLYQFAT